MSDERYDKVMNQFGAKRGLSSKLADKLENANPVNIKMPNINKGNKHNVAEVQEENNTVEEQSEDINEQSSNIIDEGREDDSVKEESNVKSSGKLSEPVHITQIIFAIATCVVMVIVIYFVVNVVTFLLNNVDLGVARQFFNSSLESIFERK